MIERSCVFRLFLVVLLPAAAVVSAHGESGRDIIDRVIARHTGQSFRWTLSVTTYEGTTVVSRQKLRLAGTIQKDRSAFFLEFEEPVASKGIKLLFRVVRDGEPEAFMFIPAVGLTVQINADNPSADIGGTGLTIGDFLPLLPRAEEHAKFVGDAKVGGRPAHVIEFSGRGQGDKRVLWVDARRLSVVKLEHTNRKGDVERVLTVKKFKTFEGDLHVPVEEEIVLPHKGIRIRVEQTDIVFDGGVPAAAFDPKRFGAYTGSW